MGKRLLALVITLALLATACGSAEPDTAANEATDGNELTAEDDVVEDDVEEVDSFEEATDDEMVDADAEDPDPEEDDAVAEEVDDAETSSDPIELDFEFQPLAPGTYVSNTTGVPITFELTEDWFVQPNSDGWTVITHPDSQGPDDRDLIFLRPTKLAEPTDLGAAEDLPGWPVDDLLGWLDNVEDGVISVPAEEVEIGGRSALRFEAEVTDPSICGESFFCAGFATNNEISGLAFDVGVRSVVYWVDMGDEAPLAIYIGSPASNEEWATTAEAVLATIEFGEPGPHPVQLDDRPLFEQGFTDDVPAGVQQFPAFGGLQLELDQERLIGQEGDSFVFVTDGDVPGDVEIWRAFSSSDDTLIETTDDLVAALEALGVAVEETGVSSYPLGEARQFEIVGPPGGPTGANGINTSSEGVPWQPAVIAHLWVFETERGVIVVSAESFAGDSMLEQMTALAEDVVLPSAEFVDFG